MICLYKPSVSVHLSAYFNFSPNCYTVLLSAKLTGRSVRSTAKSNILPTARPRVFGDPVEPGMNGKTRVAPAGLWFKSEPVWTPNLNLHWIKDSDPGHPAEQWLSLIWPRLRAEYHKTAVWKSYARIRLSLPSFLLLHVHRWNKTQYMYVQCSVVPDIPTWKIKSPWTLEFHARGHVRHHLIPDLKY